MANHKSTIKAHKQNVAKRSHNRELRTRARHALKSVRAAIDSGDSSAAVTALRSTVSLLDKLVRKGVIHANTASRYKSRLSHRLQKVSASA